MRIGSGRFLTILFLVHGMGANAHANAETRIDLFSDSTGRSVAIEAERLVYDDRRGILTAGGGVKVERGAMVLFADRLEIDRKRGEAVARGNVRLVDGLTIVFADSMRIAVEGKWGEGTAIELFIKERVAPAVLRETGPWKVRAVGQSRITLTAKRMERRNDGLYRLDDATITPCDCGPDEPPSFSLKAKRALLEPGEGATLSGVTFQIRDHPVIGIPAAFVPFGRRRTGFLLPRLAWSPRDGTMMGEDFFIALSRATDATLSFDYFTERGPRGGAEFRYAMGPPGQSDERGRVAGSVIRDKLSGDENRFALDLLHRQRLGERFRLLAKVELVSDTHYLNDFAYAIRDRDVEYTRSALALSWMGDDQRAAVVAEFFQNLQGGTAGKAALTDSAAIAPGRLPRFEYTLYPTRLWGPLHVRASAEALQLAKPDSTFADSNANGRRDPGEALETARRLYVTAGLEVPGSMGPIDFSVGATVTQALTLADTNGFPLTHSNVAVSSHIETELTRTFGAVRHSFVPTVDYLYSPMDVVRGGLAGGASVDEIDWMTNTHRLQIGLLNRVRTETGAFRFIVDLALGQSIDLAAPSLGDQRARFKLRASSGANFIEARADTSYRLSARQLVETSATFSSRVWKLGATVTYFYLLEGERERFLFEDIANPLARGVRVPLAPLATFHEVTARPEIEVLPGLGVFASFHYSFRLEQFLDTMFGATYRSPCNCWSASVTVMKRFNSELLDFFATFDLAFLGSGGITYMQP